MIINKAKIEEIITKYESILVNIGNMYGRLNFICVSSYNDSKSDKFKDLLTTDYELSILEDKNKLFLEPYYQELVAIVQAVIQENDAKCITKTKNDRRLENMLNTKMVLLENIVKHLSESLEMERNVLTRVQQSYEFLIKKSRLNRLVMSMEEVVADFNRPDAAGDKSRPKKSNLRNYLDQYYTNYESQIDDDLDFLKKACSGSNAAYLKLTLWQLFERYTALKISVVTQRLLMILCTEEKEKQEEEKKKFAPYLCIG